MVTAIEVLKDKLEDYRKELLVLQFDMADSIKQHNLKFVSLKKKVGQTLKELDKALDIS